MSDRVTLLHGDCLAMLDTLDENSVDSCCTDPPYHLTSIVKRFGGENAAPAKDRDGAFQRQSRGFMGKQWDGGDIAFRVETWEKVYRVLKPGAFLCAFSATRTYHRMVTAIEDAGFIIRDQLDWLYGSGFPKSMDMAKAIDKTLGQAGENVATGEAVKRMIPGADQHKNGWTKDDGREYVPHTYSPATDDARAWNGWGTALKPAHEPIVLAQKPLGEKTYAANVLKWGVGALNIADTRIPTDDMLPVFSRKSGAAGDVGFTMGTAKLTGHEERGRWPANIIHDGSDDVEREFAAFMQDADVGSPARFFYSAKASDDDRLGSKHPTVKPIDLMAWLIKLTTRAGGTVLDPFSGSGSTAMAALREGRRCIAIEREAEYVADIRARLAHVAGTDTPLFGVSNDNVARSSAA